MDKNSQGQGGSTNIPSSTSGVGQLYGFHAACASASENPESLSKDVNCSAQQIKNKARELGADLVGICRLNRRWLYKDNSLDKHHGTVDFSWVIVVGIAMNAESFRVSPSPAIRDETSNGYRRMERVAGELSRHIATLGYNAFSTGNGLALSVPQAVEAGLGRLGRNSLLIAEQFGPCLRICKVFTDMPLKADRTPQAFLAEICRDCSLCADACPAAAIETGRIPLDKVWRIDGNLCSAHWKKVNRECAGCIAACPATWRNRVS